jgi:hypothetical protein|tara:strand:+ start:1578 stop:1829 length:252 start_codon:yes stop_codon:yes gene_type:complete
MSEMMVLFATAMLWHNAVVAGCIFGIAVFGGMCRYAIEFSEKQKIENAKKQAISQINDQASEIGEAIGNLFAGTKKKTNTNLH